MVLTKTITMDEDQAKWIKTNFINLSAFIRQKIAIEQQKEKKEEDK